VALVEEGALDCLVFECLGERTVALAQGVKARNPAAGYDPLLERRMRAVLPAAVARGVTIITNMGAANPRAAAQRVVALAQELGLSGLKVAAVTGDDVLDSLRDSDAQLDDTGPKLRDLGERLVSANAYIGADPLVQALKQGAQVVIAGRVSDPAMFLAPMIHRFGWAMDDWLHLGRGTLVGHLLECAGQVSGGYFADPGHKEVPGLADVGLPLAEVDADGEAVITKLEGSGGLVTRATCTEQLLYEIHDPATYFQPDVIADFSAVDFIELGRDRVRATGAIGHRRSGMLKVSVGYADGWLGEGQISYAGPGAEARARLTAQILSTRIARLGPQVAEVRVDLIGRDSIRIAEVETAPALCEVRLRFAARCTDMQTAAIIGEEVEALYLNGPAGGGGVTRSTRQIVAIGSVLEPEGRVRTEVEVLTA